MKSHKTEETKRIQFHITRAIGLPSVTRSGKAPTAYVSVDVSHCKVTPLKTSTVKNHDPEWHENLAPMTLPLSSMITLEVKHRSPWSKSRHILARVERRLSDLLDMQGRNDRETLIYLPLHTEMACSSRPTLLVNIRELSSQETAAAAAQAARAAALSKKTSRSGDLIGSIMTVHARLGQLAERSELLASDTAIVGETVDWTDIALGIVTSAIEVVKDQFDQDASILQLVETVGQVYWSLETSQSLPEIELLQPAWEELLRQTIECMLFIQEYSGHGFAAKSWKISDSSNQIDNFNKAFEGLKAVFRLKMSLHDGLVITGREKKDGAVKINQSLLLHTGNINTSTRPHYISRNEAEMIKTISQWATTASGGSAKIFWLHDRSGRGKTTICPMIAHCFEHLKRLGGYISFSQNRETKSNSGDVLQTLAYQLSMFNSQIANGISDAIEKEPEFGLLNLSSQFQKLIMEPLCAMGEQSFQGPFLIIIDALDQCGIAHEWEHIVSLLVKYSQQLPAFIHILITSLAVHDGKEALVNSSNIFEYVIEDGEGSFPSECFHQST